MIVPLRVTTNLPLLIFTNLLSLLTLSRLNDISGGNAFKITGVIGFLGTVFLNHLPIIYTYRAVNLVLVNGQTTDSVRKESKNKV